MVRILCVSPVVNERCYDTRDIVSFQMPRCKKIQSQDSEGSPANQLSPFRSDVLLVLGGVEP